MVFNSDCVLRAVAEVSLAAVLLMGGGQAAGQTFIFTPGTSQAVFELSPHVSDTAGWSGPNSIMVSCMRIQTGNWSIKPLYKATGGVVQVIGFFVAARPGTTVEGNLEVVYFERPAVEDGPWIATTWEGASPADAAKRLMERYGISSIQHRYFDLYSALRLPDAEGVAYNKGFVAGDVLESIVVGLPGRDANVDALKAAGKPVADLAFEKHANVLTGDQWLWREARWFESVIGKDLSDGLKWDVALTARDLGIPYEWPPGQYPPPNPHCAFQVIEGPWRPKGRPCDCVTSGPSATGCGTFTANASGKITFHIPVPPPLGTLVELQASVGATLSLCACVWKRECIGRGERVITTILPDCSRHVATEEADGIPFTRYFWATAASADHCASALTDPWMPPANQPCGLERIVSPVPIPPPAPTTSPAP
jgi:hypothetical protein